MGAKKQISNHGSAVLFEWWFGGNRMADERDTPEEAGNPQKIFSWKNHIKKKSTPHLKRTYDDSQ